MYLFVNKTKNDKKAKGIKKKCYKQRDRSFQLFGLYSK